MPLAIERMFYTVCDRSPTEESFFCSRGGRLDFVAPIGLDDYRFKPTAAAQGGNAGSAIQRWKHPTRKHPRSVTNIATQGDGRRCA